MHGAITTNFRMPGSLYMHPRAETLENMLGRGGLERKPVSRHAMTVYSIVGALFTGLSVVLCLWNGGDFWGFVAAGVFGAAALTSFVQMAAMWFDLWKWKSIDEERMITGPVNASTEKAAVTGIASVNGENKTLR